MADVSIPDEPSDAVEPSAAGLDLTAIWRRGKMRYILAPILALGIISTVVLGAVTISELFKSADALANTIEIAIQTGEVPE